MANIYSKVPVKVQKKSGFDKSFKNLFTSKVGTITPIMCDELIPNTTVNLKVAITTQMPPLASDTFMNVRQKYAAFFVPTRLLMRGYENWLVGDVREATSGDDSLHTPVYQINKSSCNPGTLADYLGIKQKSVTGTVVASDYYNVSAFPFLAYHRIYDDWFRNSLVQSPVFNSGNSTTSVWNAFNSQNVAPWSNGGYRIVDDNATPGATPWTKANSDYLGDGVRLKDLRQANYGYDLFTSCTPQAQNGSAQTVSFSTSGTTGEFTISALRAANSLQQFLERNNLAGNRLVDYVKAQYGANLGDAVAQRPILIGSGSFDVYSKGIYQTTDSSDVPGGSNNPFTSTGTRYGNAYVEGQDLLIKGFTSSEPGYLMVVTWLSPKVTYSTGIDPMLTRYIDENAQSDMANPILQNVGNEPIRYTQLNAKSYIGKTPDEVGIFGYNERYANWKDKQDEVHGLMRDGENLQSFALQRSFDDLSPEIGDNFLGISTSYLDQITAASEAISNYGYWSDCYFDYKVTMPLARYSVPSLQDPAYEHGEDIVIDKAGKQLN